VLFAIGSDMGWRRLTDVPKFAPVVKPSRATNVGRVQDRVAIHADITAIQPGSTRRRRSSRSRARKDSHAPINTVPQAMQIEAIAAKLTVTTAPDSRRIRMQPMAVDQAGARTNNTFPPRYGEHSEAILREVGYGDGEIARLRTSRIIAGPDAVQVRESRSQP